MLTFAIILFLVAAVFGSIILIAILKNRPTPSPVVVIHGVVAAIALLTLIAYVIATGSTSGLLLTGLGIIVLAAIGGFTLLSIDMSGKPIPKLFAIMHPTIAVIGVVTLIIYALKQL